MAQSRYEARQAAQVLQRSKATKPLSNQGIVAKPCGSKRSETPSAKVVKRSFGDQQPQALKAAQVAERRWLNQPTELDNKQTQSNEAKPRSSEATRIEVISYQQVSSPPGPPDAARESKPARRQQSLSKGCPAKSRSSKNSMSSSVKPYQQRYRAATVPQRSWVDEAIKLK